MLEAREVTVEADGTRLLDGVSVEVPPGQVTAVVGPNGAGKSTLLAVISGERTPSAGEVWLEGRRLAEWPRIERARTRAVLPQDSTLAFAFTALEVVLIGRTPHVRGAEQPADLAIARAALEAAGAADLEARLYPTLSGGERQRVQLARVLAQIWEAPPAGARYLLLDEPTSSLDLAHQHDTLALARRFAAEGAGVVAILHDLNLAAQYADRIVVLRNGRLIAAGSAGEVLTPEVILEVFGMPVIVGLHPHLDCPLVIPLVRGGQTVGGTAAQGSRQALQCDGRDCKG
jgi:iron complex transport system ATP-binding protein